MIEAYFTYLNQISVGFLLLGFLVLWIRGLFGNGLKLERIVLSSLSAATIPTGLALILCAFDSDLVQFLKDLHLHLSIAGAVLLFVVIRAIVEDFKVPASSASAPPVASQGEGAKTP